MNSGGYIPRHKVSRYISSAVHQPWKGSSCFSINQISWIKIKTELFVIKRRHLGRICLHLNGQCFGITFYDFVTNSVIIDKLNFVSFLVFLLVQLLHLPLKFHLSTLFKMRSRMILNPVPKQWKSKDIPSYRSQSECVKIAMLIHWFGEY